MSLENKALANSFQKFSEADYFATLMVKTEMIGKGPLSTEFIGKAPKGMLYRQKFESQFSYLLSAFLNACYSSVAYLQEVELFRNEAKKFMKVDHPFFYRHISHPCGGGLRSIAVHARPVVPVVSPQRPVPYSEEWERFFEEWEADGGRVVDHIDEEKQYFYFDESEEPGYTVTEICSTHVIEIGKLIKRCEIISSGGDPETTVSDEGEMTATLEILVGKKHN